jgi:hypothetical protein
MALVTTISFSEEDEASQILMVSYAVGANAANWWTDIQLIQYMIGSIYFYCADGQGEWKQSMSRGELAALPDPQKDFKALKRTADLISRFQRDAAKQGIVAHVDGRVDPTKVTTSSRTKTPYTILIANYFLSSALKQLHGEEVDWIEMVMFDQDLPVQVQAQLYASRKALG